MQALLEDITLIAIGGFASYVLISFVLAFTISHRITGPMVALTDIMRQFAQGNLDYRRPLRRGDQLGQLHSELMSLGGALRQKDHPLPPAQDTAERFADPRVHDLKR